MRRARDSRRAILEAATAEFADRGFDGATVDRISARAGVNKAMIYYHFGSMVRLYRDILRGIFETLHDRTAEIAASSRSPEEKVDAFVEALIATSRAQPAFPRIMAREVADGGRHLDAGSVRLMTRIPRSVTGIIEEGVAAGRFRAVDPFLCYFSLIGPVILYQMSAPVRAVAGRLKLVATAGFETDAFVVHMKTLARRTLERDDAGDAASSPAGAPGARSRRHGEQA